MQTAALAENSFSHLRAADRLSQSHSPRSVPSPSVSWAAYLTFPGHPRPLPSKVLLVYCLSWKSPGLVSVFDFFFPPSVLFSVQHHHYFTWLAVDNFSLWNSLSFKFNFLIVSWERNAASGLCFIIYILGGNKQRHGNSKDSFRDEVQANTWYMSSSY